jgi:hypothetical protein
MSRKSRTAFLWRIVEAFEALPRGLRSVLTVLGIVASTVLVYLWITTFSV